MPYAVLNLATRSVQIDHEGAYSIVDDGPRFQVAPLSMGDGPAVFDDFRHYVANAPICIVAPVGSAEHD